MKCTLCNKEFSDDISDFDIFLHFAEYHKKQLEETSKNIGAGVKEAESKLKKGKVNKEANSNGNISKLNGGEIKR